MGISDSRAQEAVTPSRPLRNRHLSNVIDPRSPSVGIPRTPIEVAESLRVSPAVAPEEEMTASAVINDPRSPTQGIMRTPLRPSLHASLNLLAKQLSEVFVSEDSGPEANKEDPAQAPEDQAASEASPALPAEEEVVKEPEAAEEVVAVAAVEVVVKETEEEVVKEAEAAEEVVKEAEAAEEVVKEAEAAEEVVKEAEAAEEPAIFPSAAPAEPPPTIGHQQKPRGKSPHASGTKNIRQRNKKSLVSANGRSPLKVLREDNSPSAAMQNRQVKKIPFQSEQPSIRSLKISHCGWELSHNKENAQYTQSES